MAKQEITVELLLGRRVRAANNRLIGRIEEIHAEQREGECFVEEYFIGSYAWLERLAEWQIALPLVELLGGSRLRKGYRVPWDKLDLSDAEKPRLKCPVDELEPLHR